MTAAAEFVDELRTDPRFATIADQVEQALRATDIEADYNLDATAFFEAISWIIGHKDRSLAERFEALNKLVHHSGSTIELHQFTGWPED